MAQCYLRLIIIGRILPYINFLVRTLTDITAGTKAGPVYFTTVLKVVGIAYLAGLAPRYAEMQVRAQLPVNWNWPARSSYSSLLSLFL